MAAGLFGCSKTAPESTARVAAPTATATGNLAAANDPTDTKHGSRRLKGIDVPVYVDGSQRGVLRYGEVPSLKNVASETAPAFILADYLRSIGVAPATVKSIYLFDNTNRVGSIEGSELVSDERRFVFHFVAGTSGNASPAWDTTGLKNGYVVHEIRRVGVYVSGAAPSLHAGYNCVPAADGKCSEEMPGAKGDLAKGTRVYVDGRMVGFVKRRQLADSIILGKNDEGDYDFSLAKLLTTFGADVHDASALLLVSGDDVIGRASAAEWKTYEAAMHFTLGKHQHGKIRVHVPAAMQAQEEGNLDRDALVTSIHFFKHAAPQARELVSISEATDMSAELASSQGEGHGEGGGDEREDSQKR